MQIVISFIGVMVLIILFIMTYPHFGKRPQKMKRKSFETSPNYQNGVFSYPMNKESTSFSSMMTILRDFTITRTPNRKPKERLQMDQVDFSTELKDHETSFTWFGHSALYIEMSRLRVLVDPMFGTSPTPFPQLSKSRYSGELPFEIEKLPEIDVVLLSHDHYDHLDYGTIKQIKNKVKKFVVPLGVGSHLERWGVSHEKIIELDWWEKVEVKDITFRSAPARHFSGRNLHDRNHTLWCSWMMETKQEKFFFSGDGGYGPHFKEIGDRYGPFDLAFLECGQYDERWASVHMFPEQTVQASIDVKANQFVPIHWGAFTLALHSWSNPVERASKEAARLKVPIVTPKIGEKMVIGSSHLPTDEWWK
ncbi:MBL fold metallo-hydrolase [Bacillus spongiae]|uniref:MBL fold metallo-hydrolase n=1 Tax=Bacillus spongiae TaxID=2683610 RepID=A0ABU8HFS8_9BACI